VKEGRSGTKEVSDRSADGGEGRSVGKNGKVGQAFFGALMFSLQGNNRIGGTT